jgi:hypothetical protein
MVTGGLHDERLVQDERGLLQTRVEVADGPFLERLAHRELTWPGRGEVLGGPLHRLSGSRSRWPGRRAWRRWTGCAPHVAVEPRARSTRPEAFQRIDDERQRLEVHDDAFDGVGGGDLVDGG